MLNRCSGFGFCFSHAFQCCAILILLCVCPYGISAQESELEESPQSIDSEPKFGAYKPNFAIFSFAEEDDPAVQVRFSVRYKMLDCLAGGANAASRATCRYLRHPGRLRVYFSYTTDFDFYVFSDGDGTLERESQPVRNRMTSPALHFDWQRQRPKGDSRIHLSNITTSLVHHSNGQEVEFETFFDNTSTDVEIRDFIGQLEEDRPSWMDGVSRGWNYIELKAKIFVGAGTNNCIERISCFVMYPDIKIPVTSVNDEIWWEPGNTAEYRDYNIGELTISNEWKTARQKREGTGLIRGQEASFQMQCGKRGCAANTWLRLDWHPGNGNFKLPIMFYGRYGRNEHFYNYHEKTNSFGVGLQFRP